MADSGGPAPPVGRPSAPNPGRRCTTMERNHATALRPRLDKVKVKPVK
ncbi:hypothetical protein [Streptomyces fuscichromogenes]|uniref:Uncharacterized protein n=1 Tax=Streptomyces fuscichromogenes TaxID=1324013 RepID=A0A917XFU5_9ACTN|nr:hypothetical protein [Streptomyces fuscichromogenes]GGN21670.1 hypothetical protein GCM10011578_052980 [Streptomyces fuscichromogenes]